MSSARLEVLECFALVAQVQSISEAARQLGVSQPTVSRRIAALEQHLGVTLLIREANGIALTDVGRRLLAQLAPLVARMAGVLDEVASVNERVSGEVSIAALSAYGEATLVPRLLAFTQKFPEVTFRVEFLKEVEILAAVREGLVELATLTAVPEGSWLKVHRLEDERAVLVTSFDNPQSIHSTAELEAARLVAYRAGDPLLEHFCRQRFRGVHKNRLQVVFTVNSHKSMLDVLRGGDCYAVLPFAAVSDAIANHVLRLASDLEVSGGLFLGYRAEAKLSRRCQAVVEHLTRPKNLL
jgi:DNA-binding transcriptional LysR family regulator